ncbi:uncharacterized protein V1518DRAFT_409280 [Limtongia smithiae]|uniref:uncharacterized protein n=1 Tax=Limtongia smithiae TaxID=1125753 RepID=UPI0034CE1172
MPLKSRSKVTNSSAYDDFIQTISDSEAEVPDLDDSELEVDDDDPTGPEPPTPVSSKKTKKKQTRNGGFVLDFELDEFDNVSKFDGWDFDLQDRATGHGRRQVDLDGIIQRQLQLNNQENDNQDEYSEQEISDLESEDQEEDVEIVPKVAKKSAKTNGKEKKPKAAPAPSDDEYDDVEEMRPTTEPNGDSDDQEEEQDNPEEVAKFYAKEDKQISTSVHKEFKSLSLSRPLLRGIASLGFSTPTPVQASVIPVALLGKDVVAGAVTGSGKTAAYLIPVLERLLYRPKKIASTRVVVLTPTRELSIQVADVGRKLSQYIAGIRFGLAVGGLNLKVQEQELKSRPDIVVATPGRFIDHVRNSPSFQVDDVEILIIDEADRMLEEGFQQELTELLTMLPAKRQTLLFSATMNASIKSLIQLSLHLPVRIMVNPPKQAAIGLVQEFIRIRKRETARPAILALLLKKLDRRERVMVFVSRKETAHRLRIILGLLGIKVGELHGSLSQDQRLVGITEFRNSTVPVLICTDLASRGLDIPKVEVVINYDMPKNYDVYLHRVGRTARAGRTGRSISLVGEAKAERNIVKSVVQHIGEGNNGKAVSRNIDWNDANHILKEIEGKDELLEEVLKEEKTEKKLAVAEMELKKGENMVKHWDEIKSRPKRTWFSDDRKNSSKKHKSGSSKSRE